MTRKQALLTAILLLDKVHRDDVQQVQMKLKELVDDLPVTRWGKEAILDAVEQYRREYGNYPANYAYKKRNLPTKKIVEKTFRMDFETFKQLYYADTTDDSEHSIVELTRKEALKKAIDYLQLSSIELARDVITELQKLVEVIPVSHWDLESVLDAIEQFCIEHERYPYSNEFCGYTLPSPSVVRAQFHMYPSELIDTYFPNVEERWKTTARKYREDSADHWLEQFRIFMTANPKIRNKNYDRNKPKGTPCLATLYKIVQVDGWNELCVVAGIKLGESKKMTFQIERTYIDGDIEHVQEIYKSLEEAF